MPMMFFYFLKIIFDISTSKQSKKYKPHLILTKKKIKFTRNAGTNTVPNVPDVQGDAVSIICVNRGGNTIFTFILFYFILASCWIPLLNASKGMVSVIAPYPFCSLFYVNYLTFYDLSEAEVDGDCFLHGSPFEKYLHPFPGLLKKKKTQS